VREEDGPGVGERHPSRGPQEERRVKLVLELADLPAHGGLRDAELSRSAADMALFGDGDEVFELGEAHATRVARSASPHLAIRARSKRHWTARRRQSTHDRVSVEILGAREIAAMRKVGAAAAATLAYVADRLRAGATTAAIDRWVREHTAIVGGTPSQLGYKGFPAAVCTSKNEVVCHGIPRDDVALVSGDIVNVDVTTNLGGFHGDTSATFIIGDATAEARHVVDVARRCRDAGIAIVRDGVRLGDVGAAIEALAKTEGCSIVRDFGGHGIGRKMHMDPHVPHFGTRGAGLRLRAGMVFTIEPMVNLGGADVRVLDDGWTVVTADGSLSAQFEHTVLVTRDGCEILTRNADGGARRT